MHSGRRLPHFPTASDRLETGRSGRLQRRTLVETLHRPVARQSLAAEEWSGQSPEAACGPRRRGLCDLGHSGAGYRAWSRHRQDAPPVRRHVRRRGNLVQRRHPARADQPDAVGPGHGLGKRSGGRQVTGRPNDLFAHNGTHLGGRAFASLDPRGPLNPGFRSPKRSTSSSRTTRSTSSSQD